MKQSLNDIARGEFDLPRLREREALCAASEDLRDCLLYTSDAADERSSVDLGGRRIIKKKTNVELRET